MMMRAQHAQRGQALVLSMIVMGAALIALVRYFGLGQVVAAKARHTHALDAAAYSGALVQARALNMLAYINRAQVGHHVAMAHLVTLASWASLAGTEATRLARGNPPAHLITMLFGADHGKAYLAAARAAGLDTLARSHGELASAASQHDLRVQTVFVQAQNQVAASVVDARRAMMLAVLEQNLGGAGQTSSVSDGSPQTAARRETGMSPQLAGSFDLTVHDDTWGDVLQRYNGATLRPFVQQAASLYAFLAPRDHTKRNPWVVDARCPSRRHELRRRGQTTMDGAGRWQSLDTESFHALRSNRWIGCYFREYTMGWGWIPSSSGHSPGGTYVDQPPDDFSAQDFWRWVQQSTDWNIASGKGNPLATSRAVAMGNRWPSGGLAPFFDVDLAMGAVVGFSATLRHPGPQGLVVTTRSAAETFFERPVPRKDGRFERPNLFRAYWQPRLSRAAWRPSARQETP